MFARRRGVELYYETRGAIDAAPLLLIRGLARTVLHWGAVLDELDPSFRVIVMDNRGVGRSSAPLPPYTTRQMADDAACVLDHAGIDRAAVFGVSLGGMIAQELCLRHPAKVSHLVLGCTRAGGRTGRPLSREAMLALLGAFGSSEADALARTAPFVLSASFASENPQVLARWQRIAREQPLCRRGFLGQAIAALLHDTSRRLDRIRVPTLVLTGDCDRLIDAENSRFLAARIEGARLETLAGAGHDFPTERPRELAELLRDFCLVRSAERSA